MEIFAGLSVCVLVLTALLVAIKVLALWRRTRGLPELLLGVMLLSATVIGYPLQVASTQIPVSEMRPLHVSSQIVFGIGYSCLLLFTLRVFRTGVLWARCLAGLTMGGVVAATLLYSHELSQANPRPPAEMVDVVLINTLPIGVAYFWTTIEAFLYHRRLQLRMRLGLADPVVANRVMLWGVMCLSAGIAVVFNGGALVLTGTFMSPFTVLVSSLLGLVHAGSLFLAFDPPEWYKGWLASRKSAEATA